VPFAAAERRSTPTASEAPSSKGWTIWSVLHASQGFAIGTGSAFDVTVETVASWVTEARRRGIEIVPISALANDPER
jgi:chromosome condensin MukBEF ATPase and DNA-binding subunit MukB